MKEKDLQKRYDQKKKWLEKTAAEQRSEPIKKDCRILMDYLQDQVEDIIYKPAIMLNDIETCKGYIPDIIMYCRNGLEVIIDFINPYSKHYSWSNIKQKAENLENDDYLYFVAKEGVLSGQLHISPEDFIGDMGKSIMDNNEN